MKYKNSTKNMWHIHVYGVKTHLKNAIHTDGRSESDYHVGKYTTNQNKNMMPVMKITLI